MSRTRTVVKPTREHDCLYDPNFHVSSQKDHVKAVHQSNVGLGRLQMMPIEQTMFADSSHYPRAAMRLNRTNPVPDFVSRQWPGQADNYRDGLEMLKKQTYVPSLKLPRRHFEHVETDGKDTHRFFHRPVIPVLQQMQPTSVVFAQGGGLGNAQVRREEPEPPVKTVGTQTDYRDSETQTDPYTPAYVTLPGTEPEVLMVEQLTYGKGLPAGLDEVEFIERTRAKRAWEKQLPPIDDPDQLDKRRMMMEEQEAREWAVREREIERIQNLQLEALKESLEQRAAHHEEINQQRIARLWARQQDEKERKINRLRQHHAIHLRRMAQEHANPENKKESRDLVQDYTDPGSKVFAPLLRNGVFSDASSENNLVTSRFLSTYKGFLELESDLPQFLTETRINVPTRPEMRKGTQAARQRKYASDLKDVHEEILDKSKRPDGSMRLLEKIEKPRIRPPTPTVSTPSEAKAEMEKATINLQAIIRGRALQKKMVGLTRDSRRFIDELKVAVPLQADIVPKMAAKRERSIAAQRAYENLKRRQEDAKMAAGHHVTRDAGLAIDTLHKEIIRLKEERRLHAVMMLAERERRMREAEEAGRRQKEMLTRAKADEAFQQMVFVQQDAVDDYLRDFVMDAGIDELCTEEAEESVADIVKCINNFNTEFEQQVTRISCLELASRLVHTYLIPEPDKVMKRQQVANNQELLIKVAHEKVVAHAKQIEEDLIADGFSPAWEMPQPDKLDDEDASTQGQH